MEDVDYGETDLRHIIEGDRKYRDEKNESFGDHDSQRRICREELEEVTDRRARTTAILRTKV